MIKNTGSLRWLRYGGWALATALMSCSKAESVNVSDTPAPAVSTCGTLGLEQGVQLLSARLEHLATAGLASLAGLENSRAAARVLSLGSEHVLDPFVAETQSDLRDSIAELRDKQLVSSNVESNTGSTLTFLFRPETACQRETAPTAPPRGSGSGGAFAGTGGTGSANAATEDLPELDPDCVKRFTEHPVRLRLSRIACDQGENLALELLVNADRERLLLAELYSERAELELNAGLFFREVMSIEYEDSPDGTGRNVEKPMFTQGSGTLKGSLVLNGPAHASARISVDRPIEFKTRESPLQFRLETGREVLKVEANAAQKSASLEANLGEISMNTELGNFVSGLFGLSLREGSPASPPVDMTIGGLRGTLVFDGNRDTVLAQGLGLGASPALALQNGSTLLSLRVNDAQQGPISATVSGLPDDTLELGLPAGLQVEIQYGMEPVMSQIQGPANYLARDTLKTIAAPNTTLRLFQETGWDNLALTGNQLGKLLRVSAGSVGMSSSTWPTDAVSVQADQCLTRLESSGVSAAESGHDLLSTLTVGACAP